MNRHFRDALALMDIDPDAPVDPASATKAAENQVGWPLPSSVVELLRFPRLIPAIAEAIEGSAVFPHSISLNDGSYMREIRGPVLRLLFENQGVVVWGVPLDRGDNPPVLVGYGRDDLPPTVEFATTVAEFVFAMAWDGSTWDRSPMLQAQAARLDPGSLAKLRSRYRELTQTQGWPPTCITYRFEGEGGLKILLWAGDDQCDWMVTAHDTGTLQREGESLMPLSNLRRSFWSNEPEGEELLARLRAHG